MTQYNGIILQSFRMYEKNLLENEISSFIALFASHLCLFDQCHDNVIQVYNVSTTLSMSISVSLFLHQKVRFNTFLSEKLSDKKPWSTGQV